MKLKRLTSLGKSLFSIGKEILSSRSNTNPVQESTIKENKPTESIVEVSPEQERLSKKFEIPTADNPLESSRQQSLHDSQNPSIKANYHTLSKSERLNSNMGQRNFDNHQQN
ncbi:MAG TPA: hypothetical protein VKY27_06980 [Bacteriovoracaceae bacterium]|nr:hypothetical protein [Bacteriovoracaceae bacterium]